MKIHSQFKVVWICLAVLTACFASACTRDTVIPMSTEQFSLADTLVLYTKIAPLGETSGSLNDEASQGAYWTLEALPESAIFTEPVFATFYGEVAKAPEITPYFLNFRPQQSPNGRYVLLPGIGGYTSPDGDLGTGLWLDDLVGGTARQLLPQARIATWSPDSEAIAYVVEATLYTLAVSEGAEPVPLFTDPDLWELYAHWSPNGRWIAVVSGKQNEAGDPGAPELTNTYWLAPAEGGTAQELSVEQDFAMEYTTGEMAWSPDGQLLLMRNKVFDLSGEEAAADFSGRINWAPTPGQILVNSGDGLYLTTLAGDETVSIHDSFASAWAFDGEGERLAYSQPNEEGTTDIWIFDLAAQQNQFIRSLASSSIFPIRWSADNNYLILGGNEGDKNVVWALEAKPDGSIEILLEDALLVEVVRHASQ